MESATKRWEPQSRLITAAELPTLLTKHRVIVIHCGAVWNRNDPPYDVRIQAVKPEFAEHIVFYALDIDQEGNYGFCATHNILNIPALACYIDGVWVELVVGLLPEEALRTQLHRWLTAQNA